MIAVMMALLICAVTPVCAANYRNEIVIDCDTGEVYAASNEHAKLPMASTTKVVTALIALENAAPDEVITVDKQSCNVEGSSVYLKEGEQLTVMELLYCLMLRSGNDCAMVLARNTMGSYEEFIAAMNRKAESMNLKNTHFCNPHGLHDDNHYTSCYDLAMLTREAMKNALFRKIVSTKEITVGSRYLVNKNKMLTSFQGGTGVKTGFTKRAGRCLVSSATRGQKSLVTVVLNCGDMWERSAALMEDVFNQYEDRTFASSNAPIMLEAFGFDLKIACCVKNNIALTIKKAESAKYTTDIKLYKKLVPPLTKDEIVGEFNLYYENRLLFSEKIYTINSVTEIES